MKTVNVRKLLGLVLLACYFYWQVPFAFQVVMQHDWNNEFITLSACCVAITIIAIPWVLLENRMALGLICTAMIVSGVFPIVAAAWVGFLPSKETLSASMSLGFYGISIWFLFKK
ncbi:hypothetical protein ACQ0P8_12590 [Halodesulfovibrio aestuarii]|uniref:Uncharacterized protein n=1 Tax=Halodesulfovibrio aestuarii TaxID=126333 RepID=A0A8G2CBG0_9BACT|nr:hypothetical protein [Halodesulfovibrio aestuarii]SHJ55402.1 hypothetical protein SAMN05660830_02702 [Halodesulfovibrio aestuarii]